jgi:hypothetical protein
MVAAALLGVWVGGAGCSGNRAVALDTAAPAGRAAGLAAQGDLMGEVADGKACFWVVSESGETVSLVWPVGAVAKTDPLRVEDAGGWVIATVGDAVNPLWGGVFEQQSGCRDGGGRFVLESLNV